MKHPTLKQTKKRAVRVNRHLLDMGFSFEEMQDFWEQCLQEAQIQHTLPKCNCKDVNQCETWCRAKARFAMNPPKEAHLLN